MSTPITSDFKLVSKGIVLQDKSDGSDIILVDPIEIFNLDNGPLKPFDRHIESTYVDKDGVQRTAKAEAGSGIQAKWIAADSNRETAPDVYKGETVNIYQFANDPSYYWNTAAREPSLRGRERVRDSYSNQDPGAQYDSDTSYWTEIDTKNKKVHLHVSDNDGEATSWDIVIDTKAGILTVQDGADQSLVFNSPEGSLVAELTELVHIKTKKVIIDVEEFELNADKTTTTSPDNTVDGPLEVVNGITAGGGGGDFTMTGDINMVGNLDVQGNIDATGDILAGGANSPNHSH